MYIDLVIVLNLVIDFLILFFLNKLLKRNTSLFKIVLGTLIGSLSLIVLFIPLSSFMLFLLKIIVSILMIIVTFGYHNIKYLINNLTYFYLLGIIIGGAIYLNNNSQYFNYKNYLLVPLVLYIYNKINNKIKYFNKRYPLKIIVNNKIIEAIGLVDNGNKLRDPYFNKSIIIVDQKLINNIDLKYLYVPYKALNYEGIIKCFKPQSISILNKSITNVLIGLSNMSFNIDGVNCLLNEEIMENI